MRKVLLNCETKNIEEFKSLCEFAKEVGVTHVLISHIEKSIWQWDDDRNDPYPNWGIYNATIFKVIVPDALKEFLPCDYAKRNLETICQRAEILKEYGLKAAFEGMEPAWLPDAVFKKHPLWRGPHCEQSRRSRKEYYAPCIDNPEVQKLYEESVEKLCRIVPIEYFVFLTNDSGGGLCWYPNAYAGPNGPKNCRHIPHSERASNFLSIIQKGAKNAGLDAEAGYLKGCPDIITNLKDGQFYGNITNKSSGKINIIGWREHEDPTFPIENIPLIGSVANDFLKSVDDKENNIFIRIPGMGQKAYFEFIKTATKNMQHSTVSKYDTLKKTASSLIGEKYADKLVDVWDAIDKTQDRVKFLNHGGHIFQLGTVHQRWLTRPLVPYPAELTDDEKSYYRPYLFQAQTEKEAENLVNMQGTVWLGGESSRITIKHCFDRAKDSTNKAIGIIDELLTKKDLEKYVEEIIDLRLRLKMYLCIFTNALNVISFQSILDRTDFETAPIDISPDHREHGDIRLFKLNEIIRDEVDNTWEMIGLLDEIKLPMFVYTDSEENEDVMHFGPDIRNDFIKKIDIMEKHRYEVHRLYKSYNL